MTKCKVVRWAFIKYVRRKITDFKNSPSRKHTPNYQKIVTAPPPNCIIIIIIIIIVFIFLFISVSCSVRILPSSDFSHLTGIFVLLEQYMCLWFMFLCSTITIILTFSTNIIQNLIQKYVTKTYLQIIVYQVIYHEVSGMENRKMIIQ